MTRVLARRAFKPLAVTVAGTLLSLGMFGSGPLTASAAGSVPVVQQRAATQVSADALPTAQINGVVYSQVVAGNTVFAGGSFSSARPAGVPLGTQESPRGNLMSYDVTTGTMTSFAPMLNGTVRVVALSADGATLYVGGEFTQVGTDVRNRFAAFDVATGALLSLAPSFNNIVTTMTVNGPIIYTGGWFTAVNGNLRRRLAAMTDAGALTSWSPGADRSPRAMVMTPDKSKLVVGGEFTQLNNVSTIGMGALDPQTGASLPWKINTVIKDGGTSTAITTLRADSDTIYGGGFSYGKASTGNYEGTFAASPDDGSIRWLGDCHGDTYDVAPVGGALYGVSHAHFCANIGGYPDPSALSPNYHYATAVTKAVGGTVAANGQSGVHYASFEGQPAPSMINWFPEYAVGTYTGLKQAGWSLASTSSYLLEGGEFTKVNGVPQQGLVRFSMAPTVTPRLGPISTPTLRVTLKRTRVSRAAVLSWTSSSDPDDAMLTYDVLRDGAVVSSTKARSLFWAPTAMTATNASLASGRTYAYQLRVSDADGNSVTSTAVTVRTDGLAVNRVVARQAQARTAEPGTAAAGSPATPVAPTSGTTATAPATSAATAPTTAPAAR